MRELERRFPDVLVAVGIHSGKFVAERVTERIALAAPRLGVWHPVVNDRQFRAWRAWAARGWPTLGLVDPRGYVVETWTGERTADQLAPVVAAVVAAAEREGSLDRRPRSTPQAAEDGGEAVGRLALRFPGKVAVAVSDGRDVDAAPRGRRVAVTDTGRHRVLVGRLDASGGTMHVEHVVGRGVGTQTVHGLAPFGATRAAFAAYADGPPDVATFDAPQGLAFARDAGGRAVLYVADAGNHAVRAVDLATGAVRTLAGTGARRRTAEDRAAGALASPWDVAVVDGAAVGLAAGAPALVVAMAGLHALWRVDPVTGAARRIVGGRGEGLLDGSADAALLAQPMALATDGRTLWVADAESSAVRAVTATADGAGAVRTVVGTGLFDFGDADGAGDAVRLQHPEGIAAADDGRLLVADSYNDALKWLDPATRTATTFVRGLHEPSGVAVAGGRAYVADTHAHRVLVVDLATGEAAPLRVS